MKTEIKTIVIALSALLAIPVTAQVTDTVRVVKETEVIRDTVKQTTVVQDVAPAPVADERPALKRGEFGLRYMPTFASVDVRTYNGQVVEGELSLYHGYGLMLAGNFSKNVGIQAELNYLAITQKYKDQNLDRQVDVSYLNIPVMLTLNTDKTRALNLNFVAGPQFGVNIGGKADTYDDGNDSTEAVTAVVGASGTDIGLAYGAGLEFALNKAHTVRLDAGYRGFYGIVDGNAKQSSSNPDTYNVYIRGSRKTHAAYLGLTFCF